MAFADLYWLQVAGCRLQLGVGDLVESCASNISNSQFNMGIFSPLLTLVSIVGQQTRSNDRILRVKTETSWGLIWIFPLSSFCISTLPEHNY
ncbi:hypothetical protein A1QK_11725 [Vibrio genomosp. F10 str. 9ZD137]|nr:hypothetical protein A1QK_11725 [Vibrio genomosp. F10 str. 9ZD137]